MLKTLMNLGFPARYARVYVFLMTEGPKKARDIADALEIHKGQLYFILKKLHKTGLVTSSSEYPASFSAVIFEKVLDHFIKSKKEQQEALQGSKEELLSTWRSITKNHFVD